MRLVADIGGTNARFALWDARLNAPSRPRSLTSASYPAIEEAIAAYLDGESGVTEACFAVACPAEEDGIEFTNSPWRFSRRALADRFGWRRFVTLNDFTALALGVPFLGADGLRRIRPGRVKEGAPKAVIGPGTGLGMSGLLPDRRGGWIAIAGEGGHIEFAPRGETEIELLRFIAARKGRCSVERILSGAGLANIYECLAARDGRTGERPDPAAITAEALHGADPLAATTVRLFLAILGSVAGDLALLLGARGGVYIGGGILPRLLPLLAESDFLARFADKGRLSYTLAEVPVFVILDGSAALLGAAAELARG